MYKPFGAFLQTEMTDFPTLSNFQQVKSPPFHINVPKAWKKYPFGASLPIIIGCYIGSTTSPQALTHTVHDMNNVCKGDYTTGQMPHPLFQQWRWFFYIPFDSNNKKRMKETISHPVIRCTCLCQKIKYTYCPSLVRSSCSFCRKALLSSINFCAF